MGRNEGQDRRVDWMDCVLAFLDPLRRRAPARDAFRRAESTVETTARKLW